MATDSPAPLATSAQMLEGQFADLVKDYSSSALDQLMIEATRECEGIADRRLAPFTGVVETQRADAMDVEDAMDAYVPLDPTSQLGFSRAQSLGSTLLVRHFWVREFPPRYPELWTGSIASINLFRSYSGQQNVSVSTIQFEPDTGHCRFQLGTFVPAGTTIQATYSGGYSTSPADLVRASKYLAAVIALAEIDPAGTQFGHDPGALREQAEKILCRYERGGSK
ncbi:MAG: hypothetical protein HOQ47_08555 [Streptomyces sp.]|nr:hypothetical protein [Streptomyces sp.]